MSNDKLRDSDSLNTREPHQPVWYVVPEPVAPVLAAIMAGDTIIASCMTTETANNIVTDHRLAALVPGLVEALRAAVITMQFAGDSNKEVVADRAVVIQECLDALAAVARERAGASDGDTKRFYSDKANRGYGPHSDQD